MKYQQKHLVFINERIDNGQIIVFISKWTAYYAATERRILGECGLYHIAILDTENTNHIN